MTIPSSVGNDKSDDYYYDDGDDDSAPNSDIEYLESRSVEHVPPPPYSLENQRPQKVIVRVENYIPLSEDTAQVMIDMIFFNERRQFQVRVCCLRLASISEGICHQSRCKG